tara:strand:- start:1324 stop:1650 length:327 start_codon:yes stop_codon:yes gene_type:complete
MDISQLTKQLKEISYTLESIDASLQSISQTDKQETTAFVSKRTICNRLNVPSVTLDKLIHQGVASGGDSGLVEGIHFCRTDPTERNSSKFLYDSRRILNSAWKSFKNV